MNNYDSESLKVFVDLTKRLNEIALQVENEMENVVTKDTPIILELLRQVRNYDETVKFVKSRFGEIYKRMKEEIVPKKFMEQGVTSISVNGYRYTVSQQSRVSIQKGQREAAYNWLKSNGLEDLITQTVNASTLSATAKSLAEEGVDMPDDVFNTFTFDNTSVTRVQK